MGHTHWDVSTFLGKANVGQCTHFHIKRKYTLKSTIFHSAYILFLFKASSANILWPQPNLLPVYTKLRHCTSSRQQ